MFDLGRKIEKDTLAFELGNGQIGRKLRGAFGRHKGDVRGVNAGVINVSARLGEDRFVPEFPRQKEPGQNWARQTILRHSG